VGLRGRDWSKLPKKNKAHSGCRVVTTALADQLKHGLSEMALPISDAHQQSLLQYVTLLDKWNKVYNLTAVREPERMVALHILDSLVIQPYVRDAYVHGASTLLDVGTGGGLPGIPLAITCPNLRITMLDSLQKKTTFVRQAIGELALKNAAVICERVEKFQPKEKFAIVTSRAFAELKDFVEGAAHLLADNGRMLAMKGVYPHDEIARLPMSHVVEKVIVLTVPQVEGERHLVVLKAA
jgi:16S rRNA (guanine527-N7)-methyltransferase